MDAHLIDSSVFGDHWSTEFSRSLFAERSRLARWLDVIAALARAQAGLGIIPSTSATAITQLRAQDIDIARVAEGTRETAHSTLGLIRELQRLLPETAREDVYVGATVQDITDTAAALEMAEIGQFIWSGLHSIETSLIGLAGTHRATPMIGRTHGQPGAPITFGFKAASWLDEVGRSLDRLGEVKTRCLAVQLGGAVGSLAFFGENAIPLRKAFAIELNLSDPGISWLTARDRLAEFGGVLTLATAALARIANEVFTLQRAEIGEVIEATTATTVGSITMPHKRNPERSEQVVALARLVRTNASSLSETMVQEHERDARGWKAEWVTFPTLCHHATAATALGRELIDGLSISSEVMLANVHAVGSVQSEQLLMRLTARLGKHAAQAALHEAYRAARSSDRSLTEALAEVATLDELQGLTTVETGSCAQMADAAVAAATARRANESTSWR